MMDPKSSIIELLGFNPLHTSNVKAMMTYYRELIESSNAKLTYPTLNFYCNWSVHSEISMSSVVADIFTELTRVICAHENSQGASGNLWRDITDLIGVAKLRRELISFSQHLGILTTRFDNDRSWKGFVELLFQKLKDKPLWLKDSKRQTVIYELAKSLGQEGWAIDRLQITSFDDNLAWELSCPQIREKNNRLLGPLGCT